MYEWLLILTVYIQDKPGEIRDISPEVITGFSSKQSCQNAANKISYEYIDLFGKSRNQQGITGRSHK